jgi:large subunit ribosomal protein L3
MSLGLIGKKQGMTRFFTEEGGSLPVTVVSIDTNTVIQIKTLDKDGYNSVQVTTGQKKEKHINKSTLGHFKKSSVLPVEVGKTIPLEVFQEGQAVDVSGVSKGKGFAGTVKRWNFKMQDATHGNSLAHRAPGSIGQCQTPGRVWKGKKMSGHMGSEKVTIQNLKIVSIDIENSLVLIQGSIPGATGSRVMLRPSRGEKVEFPVAEETHPEETHPEKSQPEQAQTEESQPEQAHPEETLPEESNSEEAEESKQ